MLRGSGGGKRGAPRLRSDETKRSFGAGAFPSRSLGTRSRSIVERQEQGGRVMAGACRLLYFRRAQRGVVWPELPGLAVAVECLAGRIGGALFRRRARRGRRMRLGGSLALPAHGKFVALFFGLGRRAVGAQSRGRFFAAGAGCAQGERAAGEGSGWPSAVERLCGSVGGCAAFLTPSVITGVVARRGAECERWGLGNTWETCGRAVVARSGDRPQQRLALASDGPAASADRSRAAARHFGW
jgi:hypothetical protein